MILLGITEFYVITFISNNLIRSTNKIHILIYLDDIIEILFHRYLFIC